MIWRLLKYFIDKLKFLDSLTSAEKCNILYHLGKVYTEIDKVKALEYLNEAEKFNTESEAIILNKYIIYLALNKLPDALAEVQKFSDKELRDLFTISIRLSLKEPIDQLLTQYDFENRFAPEIFAKDALGKLALAIYYNITIEKYLQAEEFNSVFEVYEKLNFLEKDKDKLGNIIQRCLHILSEEDKWEEGCQFLDTIYQKYHTTLKDHYSLNLKYYEFIFYENTGRFEQAAEVLKLFREKAFSSDEIFSDKWLEIVVEVYKFSIYQALVNKNIKKLFSYLTEIETFPDTYETQLLKHSGKFWFNVLEEILKLSNPQENEKENTQYPIEFYTETQEVSKSANVKSVEKVND